MSKTYAILIKGSFVAGGLSEREAKAYCDKYNEIIRGNHASYKSE